ncbi:MAG: hypothetical protein GXO42_02750 [bacterium]|nr:hypothetical protein [bacterium]
MRFQAFESFKILIAVIVGLLLISVFVLWITRAKAMNPQAAACVESGGVIKTITGVPTKTGKIETLFICCSKNTYTWMGMYWNAKGDVPPLNASIQQRFAQLAQQLCSNSKLTTMRFTLAPTSTAKNTTKK